MKATTGSCITLRGIGEQLGKMNRIGSNHGGLAWLPSLSFWGGVAIFESHSFFVPASVAHAFEKKNSPKVSSDDHHDEAVDYYLKVSCPAYARSYCLCARLGRNLFCIIVLETSQREREHQCPNYAATVLRRVFLKAR